jgi:hypothetical protein
MGKIITGNSCRKKLRIVRGRHICAIDNKINLKTIKLITDREMGACTYFQ